MSACDVAAMLNLSISVAFFNLQGREVRILIFTADALEGAICVIR
jgi:hypothetical protein